MLLVRHVPMNTQHGTRGKVFSERAIIKICIYKYICIQRCICTTINTSAYYFLQESGSVFVNQMIAQTVWLHDEVHAFDDAAAAAN